MSRARRRRNPPSSRRPGEGAPSDPGFLAASLVAGIVGELPPPTTLRKVERTNCLLCGGPAAALVVWMPTEEEQRRLMFPADDARNVAFRLCESCLAQPGAMDRAGERILADIEATAGVASNN